LNLRSNSSHAAEEGPAAPPPPTVETVVMEPVALRNWERFSGRLSAVEQAEIRPLVGGTLQQVLFEEGARVEKGQLLFVIDPRPFEAALQNAKANLASAESDVELARIEYQRADGLAKRNVISQSLRDNRLNDLNIAQARLESARAQVIDAELNLEYAHVRAPISGQIGRAEITVGNVIEAGGNAPVLTSIVNLDELYAEFDVDEQTYFRVTVGASQSANDEGSLSLDRDAQIPVNITLGSEQGLTFSARLQAFDNHFDATTGTIRARALLDNSLGLLVPGVFVNVDLGSVDEVATLLLPERAINVSQDKRFVYVVGANNIVEYRPVEPGRAIDGKRVIRSGLQQGERVIVNGVQRVMPDMPVLLAGQ
jgi:multidrug efflux system membrane fusion protein